MNPNWLILIVLTFAVGWYVADDVSSWPSSADRALETHRKIMEGFR